ncbi:hypothetical protein ABFX02_12G040300 [Erythranthe guttata]
MKHFVLPAFLLLLLLINYGKMEVKAETCTEELPPQGIDLCEKAKCQDECVKRHGSSASGRCYLVDSCLCYYSCVGKFG